MVTGGYTGSYPNEAYLDTMETLTTDASSWITSEAKMPRPMIGLSAANIDNRILFFGNYSLFIIHKISQ